MCCGNLAFIIWGDDMRHSLLMSSSAKLLSSQGDLRDDFFEFFSAEFSTEDADDEEASELQEWQWF